MISFIASVSATVLMYYAMYTYLALLFAYCISYVLTPTIPNQFRNLSKVVVFIIIHYITSLIYAGRGDFKGTGYSVLEMTWDSFYHSPVIGT